MPKRLILPGERPLVLVVDDDAMPRRLAAAYVAQLGFPVLSAADGEEALRLIEREPVTIVISDWNMTPVDGLALCREVRARDHGRYVYLVLLTARSGREDLLAGMRSGADDFLVKPVDRERLQVRLRAAERIISLERGLREREAQLDVALAALREDLEAAAFAQRQLLPAPNVHHGALTCATRQVASSIVSGDIVNVVRLCPERLVLYALDVCGHGARAALRASVLRHHLDGASLRSNAGSGSPATMVAELNERFPSGDDGLDYFTMLLAVVDAGSGEVRFCQAGFPPMIHLPAGGGSRLVGAGGPAVGFFPGTTFEEQRLALADGDRLLIASDGMLEARSSNGEAFGAERLMACAERLGHLTAEACAASLLETLRAWHEDDDPPDDITLICLDHRGDTHANRLA